MAKNYATSAGHNPLKILMGLSMLILGLGLVAAVIGVQNQTSTATHAASRVITPLKANLNQQGKNCELLVSVAVKNNTKKKTAIRYRYELLDLNKLYVTEITPYATQTISANKTVSFSHIFKKYIQSGFVYKVQIRIDSPQRYLLQTNTVELTQCGSSSA